MAYASPYVPTSYTFIIWNLVSARRDQFIKPITLDRRAEFFGSGWLALPRGEDTQAWILHLQVIRAAQRN